MPNRHNVIALVLISLAMIAQLLYVLHYSVNVIFLDHFDYITILNNFSWQECFAFHQEHRTFFPKLFFLFLAKLTSWDVRMEAFFNWVFLQCSIIMLYRILKRNIQSRDLWILAITLCFYLAPQYYDNLLWGFQICHQISFLGLIAALFIFSTLKNSWLGINLAAVSCIIATFSLSISLVSWIVFFPLVFMAEDNKSRRRQILYWILVTIAVMLIYFWNYPWAEYNPGGKYIPTAYPWLQTKYFFLFFFSYISAGFLGIGKSIFERFAYVHAIIGAILFMAFILGCIFNLFELKKNLPKFCLAIFLLSTALMATLVRANYQGLVYAVSDRWRMYSALFPVLMINMLMSGSGIKKRLGKIIFIFLFLGIIWGGFFGWRSAILDGKGWYIQRQEDRKSLFSFETATDQQLKNLHPAPGIVREGAATLKRLKYNVFK